MLACFMKRRLEHFQKRSRFIQCRNLRMCIKNLLQQRRAASGMSPQKSQPWNSLALPLRKKLCPGVKNCLRLCPRELSRPFRVSIIPFDQEIGIGKSTNDAFSLLQELHRFIKTIPGLTKLGQFVPAGVANKRMFWVRSKQIP